MKLEQRGAFTFDELEEIIAAARREKKPPHLQLPLPVPEVTTGVEQTPPRRWQSDYELIEEVARKERGYLLDGHGDGLHLLLGDSCLCGVTVDAQSGADGCKVGGGCRKSRAVKSVRFAADMRGDVCFLLSCNSANLAAQYGSPSLSIARTLLENGFSMVIASIRQVPVNQKQIDMVKACWAAGDPVEAILQRLNDLPEVDGAYLLLTGVRKGARERTGELSTLRMPSKKLVSPAPVASIETPVTKRVKQLRAIEEVILASLARVGTASALSRRLREQEKLVAGLARLETQAFAVKTPPDEALRTRVHSAIRNGWEECVAAGWLGAQSGFGDVLQKAFVGRAPLTPGNSAATGQTCQMCSGRVWRTWSGLAQQWGVYWCNGCGVKRASVESEKRQFLTLDRSLLAGERYQVQVPLSGDIWPQVVFTQVRDKSQSKPLTETTEYLAMRTSDVLLQLPNDAGPDIGSIRVVVMGAYGLVYLREVFGIRTGGIATC